MNKQSLKGFIPLTFSILLFSTFEVTCKLIGTRLHPFQISFFRFLCGGLVLLPFAIFRIRKQRIPLTPSFWFDMGVLGFVNIVVSMGLIQFGLLYTNASTAAVIFSGNPLFVALFAALLLQERVGLEKWLGMAVGLSGVIVLFLDKIKLPVGSILGPILVLLSAIIFAWYTVLGKRQTLRGVDSLVMTSISFLAGCLFLLPLMLGLKIPLLKLEPNLLPHLFYLGILTTGVAYMLYFYGLAHVNTTSGALIYFLKPVMAAIFSVIILHETLNLNFYLGTLIILAALIIVNFKQFFRVHPKASARIKTDV